MLAISADASKVLESSLNGLSAAQILAKTNTLGLTEAQKIELIQLYATDAANYANITSTAGITAAQKSSTVAINLNTMSKIGNKEATEAEISEEIKSLLLKGKLITEEQIQAKTTIELTKAKIADAVATGNLTKAEGKQLTSTLGLTGATGGLGTAFKGLGAKIKVLHKYHYLE